MALKLAHPDRPVVGVTGDGVRFIAESDESLRTSRGVGGDEVREDADEKVR